jgi:glutathione synthase/RimK-type ligase-like ATP-grasp enzyme
MQSSFASKPTRAFSPPHARRVMIVTQEIDPHADLLVMRLLARGHNPIRFHPQSLGSRNRLACKFENATLSTWEVNTESGKFSDTDICSVWYRRPHFVRDPSLPEMEAVYIEAETREAVMGAFRVTSALWVNHPDAIRVAESKPFQLRLARETGFSIPRTLITNDPAEARGFYDSCDGAVVFKSLTLAQIGAGEGKGIYTSAVQPRHLEQLNLITLGPCLFQEHIPKAVDLRVTVIGDRLFPVAIYSQDVDVSRVDWRRGDVSRLRHALHKLPPEIEQSCHKLLQRLGLNYGAIDLILTPDGEYIFLEINPSGQFAWLEAVTGLKLVDSLIDLLLTSTA